MPNRSPNSNQNQRDNRFNQSYPGMREDQRYQPQDKQSFDRDQPMHGQGDQRFSDDEQRDFSQSYNRQGGQSEQYPGRQDRYSQNAMQPGRNEQAQRSWDRGEQYDTRYANQNDHGGRQFSDDYSQGYSRFGQDAYGAGRTGWTSQGSGRDGYGNQHSDDNRGERTGLAGGQYERGGGGGGGGGQYARDPQFGNPMGDRNFVSSGSGPSEQKRRGPKGYTRSDDRIKEDISDKLGMHHELDASEVEVMVKDGEVTLTGTVKNRNEKFIAEQISEQIGGVKDVTNQIRVARESDKSSQSPTVEQRDGADSSLSRTKSRTSS